MNKYINKFAGFRGIFVKLGLVAISIPLFFISGCRHDVVLDGIPEVKFTEVQGILSGSCGSSNCHGAEGETFSLIGYENIIDHGHVQAGDARKSRLYTVLTASLGNIMPPSPNSPLSDDQIKKIYIWIEQGAKNN